MSLLILPYLRRGLAQAVQGPSPITATLTVNGRADTAVTRAVALQGPGAVLGIPAAQLQREEPRPNTADHEPNYFPFVELSAPDLPWMFTPVAPVDGKLAPWIVLIVVEAEAAQLRPASPLPRLSFLSDPKRQLPELSQSWAWAHAQVAGNYSSAAALAEALETEPWRFCARLICPRRLDKDRAYLAAIVPAFAAGLRAGLGLPDDGDLSPAWDHATLTQDLVLPVYHSWSFRTAAERGDFEHLARKLDARPITGDIGVKDMDVTDPGGGVPPWDGDPVYVSYQGALQSPDAKPTPWDPDHRAHVQGSLTPMLEAWSSVPEVDPDAPAPRGYMASANDPVCAPPRYGGSYSDAPGVPAPREEPRWLRGLNLSLHHRAAAGLGARVVREHQERYVAEAWAQAGALREVNQALAQAQLAEELGRLTKKRLEGLPEAEQVRITHALHAKLPAGAGTVAGLLADSVVPQGLTSAAAARLTRPQGRLDRSGQRIQPDDPAPLGRRLTQRFLQASAEPDPLTRYAKTQPPHGQTPDDVRALGGLPEATLSCVGLSDADRQRVVEAVLRDSLVLQEASGAAPAPADEAPTTDVSALAGEIRRALKPQEAVAQRLRARLTLPEQVWPQRAPVPPLQTWGPTLNEATYARLRAISPELLLPGVGRLEDEVIGLVDVNDAFVAAFLAGMNEALRQELRLREFPLPARHTLFSRFWDSADPSRADIKPMAQWLSGWPKDQVPASQDAEAGGERLALLARGSLFRRYPRTFVYALEAAWDGQERALRVDAEGKLIRKDPLFIGTLSDDVAFFGFDLAEAQAKGSTQPTAHPGWYFVLEQPATEPRFGLDEAAGFGGQPATWEDLHWGQLAQDRDALAALTHVDVDAVFRDLRLPLRAGAARQTWGKDAGHMGRIIFQPPFRLILHADQMLE